MHFPLGPYEATGNFDTSDFAINVEWDVPFDGQFGTAGSWSGAMVPEPGDFDTYPTSLAWNGDGVDVAFVVTGPPVMAESHETPVSDVHLFWASGPTAADIITSPLGGALPIYWNQASGSATITGLPDPPDAATHLIVYTDPGEMLEESNEDNNIVALEIDDPGFEKIGVRRDTRFVLDCDGSGSWTNGVDRTFIWGSVSDTLLIGDWNGDGYDEIGVRQSDGRFLLDVDGSGRWSAGDRTFFWGSPTDTILIGDWDGDGDDTIGVRWADGRYVLDVDGSGRWSAGDRTYFWGLTTDTPIVGNWAPASPLMAAESATGNDVLAPLSDEALAPLVETAVAARSSLSLSADQTALLDQVHVQIADLPGLTLGQTVGTGITLDIYGAGWGWFIDATPDDDAEFLSSPNGSTPDAQRHMDSLTVVLHELGHVLGYGHDADFDAMLDILRLACGEVCNSTCEIPRHGQAGLNPVSRREY